MASEKPTLRGHTELVGIIDDLAFFPLQEPRHVTYQQLKKRPSRGPAIFFSNFDDFEFLRIDSSHGEPRVMTDETKTAVDTSDERIAVVCMIVSNPGGTPRVDDWKKQVNDVIRALRDERNDLRKQLADNERSQELQERADAARGEYLDSIDGD